MKISEEELERRVQTAIEDVTACENPEFEAMVRSIVKAALYDIDDDVQEKELTIGLRAPGEAKNMAEEVQKIKNDFLEAVRERLLSSQSLTKELGSDVVVYNTSEIPQGKSVENLLSLNDWDRPVFLISEDSSINPKNEAGEGGETFCFKILFRLEDLRTDLAQKKTRAKGIRELIDYAISTIQTDSIAGANFDTLGPYPEHFLVENFKIDYFQDDLEVTLGYSVILLERADDSGDMSFGQAALGA